MAAIDEHSHGGNLRALSRESGKPQGEILDFSANLNPLGPPPWLSEAVAAGLAAVAAYPDPDSGSACLAASARFGLPPERFLFADGADSIILALPRAMGARRVLAFSPGYSGYRRAADRAGASYVPVGLDADSGFALDAKALEKALASGSGPTLVFVGAPNNPAGGFLPEQALLDIAEASPEAVFAVDESFSELAGRPEGLVGRHPDNVLIVRSLTKTFAMPGLRSGYAEGSPSLLRPIRKELPAWPLSSFAEEASIRALADREWGEAGSAFVAEARASFARGLSAIGGLRVFPGPANFILVGLEKGLSARALRAELLRSSLAIRIFSPEEGLDDSWFRLAVRRPEENRRLVIAIGAAIGDAIDDAMGRMGGGA